VVVRVEFAPAIQRHVACAPQQVEAATLREALNAVFVVNSALRNYVLDDQAALRRHVTVFVDGEQLVDRKNLSDRVHADAEIYVVQALSGG
jgi:sulfur-carrier protein